MKKTTLLLFFLTSALGFSQAPIEKIQTYMNENRSKLALTNQDLSDLVIVNTFSSEATKINNYHVKQRYKGVEIYNSDSNFWIKNGEVIKGGEDFIQNIASKTNSATPSISVIDGFSKALAQLNESPINGVQILKTNDSKNNLNKFKLTNGRLTEDPINAQLVYFSANATTLKLAWSYEFYCQDGDHLWNVKIDALNGKLLDKQDLVISCHFGTKNHAITNENNNTNNFTRFFLKENTKSLVANPGTTNYRVIKWNWESPNHAARTLETNPESTALASPNGWHNASTTIGTSTTTFNYTKGNNVFAYTDANNDNPTTPTTYTTASSGTYPNLTFDFPYAGNSVDATTYTNAATTNLFYQNNIMHDVWYQYGFNEANGNFQTANFGRGGNGNDAVNAEAQDSSARDNAPTRLTPARPAGTAKFNNANFSSPRDGSKPRMQMYLWDSQKPNNLLINTGTLAGKNYPAADNGFTNGHVNLPVAPATLTNNLVLYVGSILGTPHACDTARNSAELAGKIAVIRRGGCTFERKVKSAQNAGAIGVIIVNTEDNSTMYGDDATITIPAISISQADGEELINAMSSGNINVSISKPEVFVNTDGDFDNGVIAHEYTHGISSRLSGTCLAGSEQMGEGWSDWAWLMMQIKPGDTRNDAKGIGTFAENQPTNGGGIRKYKYSTDMTVNPHTYNDSNAQWSNTGDSGTPPNTDKIDVHGLGSIWCAILWDLAWNYIDKYGYDPNIYNGTGGNNMIMQLVLDGIKLTGCKPTFVSGRDSLIAADEATTGGQNYCMIWKTFARRGVGVNASAGGNDGSVTDIKDQVADFTEPPAGPNCTSGLNYFENKDMIKIYPNPSNGLVNIKINQFTGKVNLQVIDLNGRVVYSLKNTDFNVEKTINLNNLQSGMYIIKIDGDELNYTKKIILN
ncbi:T9SS-dependent M36 family metallopeptidase [Flavobacterium psychrophilum]|uniref:T9SS-dependent M36 family metallopeptidase n=1 Tax=Flavobacterium psychrophilum TaxID=96345 RepID=UPI00106A08A1|nr:T9SS-dependent M36 family metallopeptidase [Flavobacterium psychrophilum]MCB5981649.1 T9SS-dependent M36 family metallopeptidase [Flavobacterium psychrophilum]QRE11679.1 T9SS-dependent M36 family metallopeptidase [Flavobacterium psychrophilum]QRE28446.1 T9SS-dependent M36 family metallopeptidase [Flavobacterium psychrophilum]QRE30836.1 T9SS-dependent M36 family metallopeptidase [Flavobacterium psychrophilum]QRE45154.1 T9SS-dependent M36 family metallopeptidase [Flavobacterium psychrophilum]